MRTMYWFGVSVTRQSPSLNVIFCRESSLFFSISNKPAPTGLALVCLAIRRTSLPGPSINDVPVSMMAVCRNSENTLDTLRLPYFTSLIITSQYIFSDLMGIQHKAPEWRDWSVSPISIIPPSPAAVLLETQNETDGSLLLISFRSLITGGVVFSWERDCKPNPRTPSYRPGSILDTRVAKPNNCLSKLALPIIKTS